MSGTRWAVCPHCGRHTPIWEVDAVRIDIFLSVKCRWCGKLYMRNAKHLKPEGAAGE